MPGEVAEGNHGICRAEGKAVAVQQPDDIGQQQQRGTRQQ